MARLLLGAAVVAALLGVLAPLAPAGEAEAHEVWHFEKGGVVRDLDVSGLDPAVRADLARRLAADGFRRVAPAASDDRRTGRDLARDVEALVRHGGRFPGRGPVPVPAADTAAAERRLAEGLCRISAAGTRAGGDARLPQLLLAIARVLGSPTEGPAGDAAEAAALGGARRLALEQATRLAEALAPAGSASPLPPPPRARARPGTEGAVLLFEASVLPAGEGGRTDAPVVRVPPGSAAACLGLRPGDRVLCVDGAPPTRPLLASFAGRTGGPGQRTLRLRRTDGRIETWELRRGTGRPPPCPADRLPPGRRIPCAPSPSSSPCSSSSPSPGR